MMMSETSERSALLIINQKRTGVVTGVGRPEIETRFWYGEVILAYDGER